MRYIDFKVSKKKTSKPNIIINDDSNETKEKKVIKKIRIKKSNNNEICRTIFLSVPFFCKWA